MAVKENGEDDKQALGPSIVLGLVGAVVVLLLLGAGVWGVGKIISKIRESGNETEEEVAEETTQENENASGSEEESQGETEESSETSETSEAESSNETSETSGLAEAAKWVANNYVSGDITGDTYTVVWGDTLWEIAEARYGSGFEWGKIREANSSQIGYLPNGSQALIFPGQVLTLPE